MCKRILPLILALGIACTTVAQENDGIVYPNTFFASFSVGGNSYTKNHEGGFAVPSVSLSGGVWLAMPLAVQLNADAMLNDGNALVAVDANFKWDLNATFFHVYNRRFLYPVPFYPILGLGTLFVPGAGEDQSKNAFQLSLGLQAPFRVADHWDAMLQYKCIFLPQGFDGSQGDNYLHTFGIGLLWRQSYDPYHRRIERYTRGIAEDWFLGLGVGPNYSAFELFTNPDLGGFEMFGWAPEVMVGRNFSNFWSVRFVLGGLTAHEAYDTVEQRPGNGYRYGYLHADVLLNVSNLIWRGRGVRFNMLPYLGAGPVWRFDDPTFKIAANAGLQLRYYLSRHSDIYLDARYVMVEPSVGGGEGPSGKFYGVGLPSLTLGYIYNFGHNTTRYRIPLDEVRR